MRDNYTAVLEQARHEFAAGNSMEMARFSGASLTLYPPASWREFILPYLGRIYRITWPAGEVISHGTSKEGPTATAITVAEKAVN